MVAQVLNSLAVIFLLIVLFILQKKHIQFNKRVFCALFLGALLGALFHLQDHNNLSSGLAIASTVSTIYIRLLQMIIFPLVAMGILSAITKMSASTHLGRSLGLVIVMLLVTTAIAACVGIFITYVFHIDFHSLNHIIPEQSFLNQLAEKKSSMDPSLLVTLTNLVPTNPFADLAGMRNNSIAATVIFFLFLGFAYLGVNRKYPETGEKFKNGVDVLFTIIMRAVILIIRLTPYGVFGLIFQVFANTNYHDLLSLISFVGASYLAILLMYIVHSIILALNGYNILTYYKKVFPLLTFAFVSRSSAASIPLNIETQTDALGVNSGLASASSAFGAILGQNACAGIYPAMLAIIVAPTVGIDPFSLHFMATLVLVIVLNSLGVAGVGGGATFAAIATFSFFNMPLYIIALLVAIEPVIDMARTSLNINGSLVASLVSAKFTQNINKDIFNS